MDNIIPPILRKNKRLLCILFEKNKYTLALALMRSNNTHIIALKKVNYKDAPFVCLPLLVPNINTFWTPYPQPTFALVVQPSTTLPQEKIFEYRLMAHCLSLNLTHVISSEDARKYASPYEQHIPLEIQGALRLFMEDI